MKLLISTLAMLMLVVGMASATWVIPDLPEPIKGIGEPAFPSMPEQTYISGLNGNFVDTHYAVGGWHYDSGWSLEDFQHTTAMIESSACTTGTEVYVSNYMESGTEASGTAWKFAEMSLLNQRDGQHEINNKVVAWTVNAVPPGADYTNIFYEEFTGNIDTGAVTHSLMVEGKAIGDSTSPTVIQTHYESDENLFQQKAVGINIE